MEGTAKILIVEDEPDIRDILKIYVRSLTYEPLVAVDGRRALELLENTHIDVIVSDLMMPYVSGMMLLNELRSRNMTIPFIFITAYPSQESSIQALRLGAYDFLEKPFEGGHVRKLLVEAVKASRSPDKPFHLIDLEDFPSRMNEKKTIFEDEHAERLNTLVQSFVFEFL